MCYEIVSDRADPEGRDSFQISTPSYYNSIIEIKEDFFLGEDHCRWFRPGYRPISEGSQLDSYDYGPGFIVRELPRPIWL